MVNINETRDGDLVVVLSLKEGKSISEDLKVLIDKIGKLNNATADLFEELDTYVGD